MKINTTNIKSFVDTQRAFDNIKTELNTYTKNNEGYIPDYGMFGFEGNPYTAVLTANSKVPNNYEYFKVGNITANLDYTYTLEANKIYELEAVLLTYFNPNATGYATYIFYDEEKNIKIGRQGYSIPVTDTSNITSTSIAKSVIQTKRQQNISLRLLSVSNLTGIYGRSTDLTMYSSITIHEIARI